MKDETETGRAIQERSNKIKLLILDMARNNPLIGKGPEEMLAVNARNLHYQDALREGMIAALITTGEVVGGFNGAMTGLLFALAQEPDNERSREAIGYILGISEAVKRMEEGPAALLNGELTVECLLRPGDTPSEEVRKHFNLPEGPVDDTDTAIRREGNVVDAREAFAARAGKKPTLH